MRSSAVKKKIIGSGLSTLASTPSTAKRIRGATPATRSTTAMVRADSNDDTTPLGATPSRVGSDGYVVGEKVFLHGIKKWGTVQYFGSTWFSDGKWVGVELLEEIGKNDGTVQGHRYFTCKPHYGVFVRPANCTKSGDSTPAPPASAQRKPSQGLTSPDGKRPVTAPSGPVTSASVPAPAPAPKAAMPPRPVRMASHDSISISRYATTNYCDLPIALFNAKPNNL
jgi:hypothetical protein